MSALERKLLRDLAHQRWQAFSIALVVAAGVASYVCVRGTYDSLLGARDRYYAESRFADVWAAVSRAPHRVVAQLEQLEGVALVYPRISRPALLPLSDAIEPVAVQAISIPAHGTPPLCDVHVSEGRLPEPGRSDELVLLDGFAHHRGIALGDDVSLVLDGTLRRIRVVGLASSSEYVFAADEGLIPGEDSFAVVWMREPVLAAAFDLEGSFDEVLVQLTPDYRDASTVGATGTHERAVLDALDRALEPYGARGAVPRRLQFSNYTLDAELEQLRGMARSVPAIFLFVAAFLLHVSLARMIELQRPEVAILKCLGYPGWRIALHYLAFGALVATVGSLLGIAFGTWLGHGFVGIFLEFFRMPGEGFRLTPSLALVGVAVSLGSAAAGGLVAVRNITRLSPADAMRPPTPTSYRRSWLTRGPWMRLAEVASTMALREAERRPFRTFLSALGVAFSVAILVMGHFKADLLDVIIGQLFERAMREDIAVELREPAPRGALSELAHLPGVLRVEGIRRVPTRIHFAARHRDVALQAFDDDVTMRALVDARFELGTVEEGGVTLTTKLAEVLGARVGDVVELEVRSGERRRGPMRVVGLVDEMFGLNAYVSDRTMRAFLREDPAFDVALLRIDETRFGELRLALARQPGIARLVRRRSIIDQFHRQTGRSMGVMNAMVTFFAAIIAIGVVYNNMRVALSMRARDLATMRVLGFTRREVGVVLFGELLTHLAIGIPLGLWLGGSFAAATLRGIDPERYRFPLVIAPSTYAHAALTVFAASLVCWLLVRRRLERLDLIAVLKTRE